MQVTLAIYSCAAIREVVVLSEVAGCLTTFETADFLVLLEEVDSVSCFGTAGFAIALDAEMAKLSLVFDELDLMSSFKTADFSAALDAIAFASRSALRRAPPGFLPFVRAMLSADVKSSCYQMTQTWLSIERRKMGYGKYNALQIGA